MVIWGKTKLLGIEVADFQGGTITVSCNCCPFNSKGVDKGPFSFQIQRSNLFQTRTWGHHILSPKKISKSVCACLHQICALLQAQFETGVFYLLLTFSSFCFAVDQRAGDDVGERVMRSPKRGDSQSGDSSSPKRPRVEAKRTDLVSAYYNAFEQDFHPRVSD